MTWQIIENGTTDFIPIIDKLWNITTEFIPYVLYIWIAILWIEIIIHAVKMIISYLEMNSKDPFNTNRFQKYEWKIYVGTPETKEELRTVLEEANNERNIEKEMYQDYEDYIYKHWKYKDWDFPTQEERLERIRKRKSEHKEYNYF